jgi:hypothetical protein
MAMYGDLLDNDVYRRNESEKCGYTEGLETIGCFVMPVSLVKQS